MQDPTRIDTIINLLGRVWSAQPDRRLVDIAAQLGTHGISPASSDDDIAAALRHLLAEHPDTIDTDITGRALRPVHIVTASSQVAIDADTVIVRGHPTTPRRPSVWHYDTLPGRRVAAPLSITPADGTHPHRFGIIERIEPLGHHGDTLSRTHLPALRRDRIGDTVYIVDLEDGTRLEIGRSLHSYTQGRRELTHTRHTWHHTTPAAVGEELTIAPPPGGKPCPTGIITALWQAR